MYPVLFDFGFFKIHTYGLFVALAFLSAIFIAQKEAIRLKESPNVIGDSVFYIMIMSIVGARLLYVIVYFDEFENNLLDIFKIWKGGLVFYGGFILSFIFIIFYVKKHKLEFFKILDILALALPFGHFLGRLGCFSAGCCYGNACALPWAVVFKDAESIAPTGIMLHPVQLYEAFANLCIFFFLLFYRKKKTFNGQIACLYISLYATTRFILEFFRGDPRGVFGIFSTSQVIAIFCFILSCSMIYYLKKKSKP